MVMELARFKVDSAAEPEFLATRRAMVEAVRTRVPGLVDISLVHLDDGSWVDVVVWASRAAADEGAKLAGALPEARQWLQHVTEDISMDLGDVIDRAGLTRPR